MKIIHKILFLAVLSGCFLIAIIFCLPYKRKDIQIEKPVETANDMTAIEDEIGSINSNEISEKVANNTPSVKDVSENGISNLKDLKEETKNDFKIIQKPVSWGYSSSRSRTVDAIIIHSSYNALGGDKYNLNKLMSEYKEYGVSPHYLIDREGKIYQLVKDDNIAYHAGESKTPDGRINVNNFSIGIELMNTESDKYTDNQYDSLNYLISYIKKDYKIKYVLGHNQIASVRKTDPWNFSWSKID